VHDLADTVLHLQQVGPNDEKSLALVRSLGHARTAKVTELARSVALVGSGNRAAALAASACRPRPGNQPSALWRGTASGSEWVSEATGPSSESPFVRNCGRLCRAVDVVATSVAPRAAD
jgi:hypothetical protein